eukprot:TRINITY_DN37030_c0_g1_i1.p1 TRINITY_DN37030_c0_g1~~TRINITY_DN37030_c0_g1_i1.p1  ORF type:complete len:206 (+),score=25.13 TRINITY_DN37030_c0_g1_i1:230-847(+)
MSTARNSRSLLQHVMHLGWVNNAQHLARFHGEQVPPLHSHHALQCRKGVEDGADHVLHPNTWIVLEAGPAVAPHNLCGGHRPARHTHRLGFKHDAVMLHPQIAKWGVEGCCGRGIAVSLTGIGSHNNRLHCTWAAARPTASTPRSQHLLEERVAHAAFFATQEHIAVELTVSALACQCVHNVVLSQHHHMGDTCLLYTSPSPRDS